MNYRLRELGSININYRLPVKVYYRISTLRHIRIEINQGSQNVFCVLTWVGGYTLVNFIPRLWLGIKYQYPPTHVKIQNTFWLP
jgi:hypothetical protein